MAKPFVLGFFTEKSKAESIHLGLAQSWVVSPRQVARNCEYVVLSRSSLPAAADDFPSHTAYLVGRITKVIPARENPARNAVHFDRYAEINVPNFWRKTHEWRNPVRYIPREYVEEHIDFEALHWIDVSVDPDAHLEPTTCANADNLRTQACEQVMRIVDEARRQGYADGYAAAVEAVRQATLIPGM